MTISEKNRVKINQPDTTFLILDSSNVTDGEAVELAELVKDKPNIKEITAYGNPLIGDRGARALFSLPYVEKLNLSNGRFSEAVIIECAPSLRLKELLLGDTNLAARGLASLLANPYIERLDVSDCLINETELLNVMLPINHTLEILHFDNPVGDRGTLKLLACLPKLEHLSIFNCHNTNEGIQCLLKQARQLKSLYVGGEQITDEAFSPLAEPGYDGQLKELDISYSTAGTKALGYILKNRILTDVFFDPQQITKEEERLLQQHLQQNKLAKRFIALTINTTAKEDENNAHWFGQSANFFQGNHEQEEKSPKPNGDTMICTP